MHRIIVFGLAGAAVAGLLLTAGCSGKPEESGAGPSAQQGPTAPAPPPLSPDFAKMSPNSAGGSESPHGAAGMGGMANPHGGAMAGVPNPHSSEQGGAEKPQVTKAVNDAAAAETRLKASPTDAALRKQVSQANLQAGVKVMTQSDQPPRVKYPGALRYFRRALELDPTNKDAAGQKALIEDIYKSMGRPVPQ